MKSLSPSVPKSKKGNGVVGGNSEEHSGTRISKMGIRGRERRCGEDDMQFDPTVETEDLAGPEGMDSLFSDLANAIPGIDEAMSFAQVCILLLFLLLPILL